MADYIYLLENRLSMAQRSALEKVREIAGNKGFTVFLVGGAVRDLTGSFPVRDLDVVVQGNATKLKKDIEKAGGRVSGESDATQSFFVDFPGGVRMEIGSTLEVSYPKPGKPVYKSATILADLRRRDFTANSMALSLNQGSFGLLMDPLNGVADIENRELRLVSPYGFIEDPVRMIRGARFMARLGFQMDERTRSRYETGKEESYIDAMPAAQKGYEIEEVFLEEDPLRVIRRLEAEGWLKYLNPAVGSAKANVGELDKLHDVQTQLHIQGIHAETATAAFPLLTAKMAAKEVEALKKSFPRTTFADDIDGLEAEGKAFAAQLASKEYAQPSAAWKLLHAARPEAVLWAAYHVKTAGVQNKLKAFYTEWPQARQKIPFQLMQEMRITPDVAGYDELLEKLFFELMDGRLGTTEEMKAFLEPYSPPAPPPPVNLRRARATRKDAKPAKKKKAQAEAASETVEIAASGETGEAAAEVKPAAKAVEKKKPSPVAKVPTTPAAPAKPVAKEAAAAKKEPAPAKKVVVPAKKAAVKKAEVKPAAVKKASPKKVAAPVKKAPAKAPVKVVAKATKKAASKPVAKKAVKPVAKKVAPKPVAKKAPVKVVAKAAKKAAPKPVAKKAVKPVSKKVAAKKKR